MPILRIVTVVGWLCSASIGIAAEFYLGQRTLKVPDDCTLEIAAESPLTEFPIFAEIDEKGRLWLGESSGVQDWNLPQDETNQENWHRLVRLTDVDGDGRYDERQVVARYDMPVHGVQRLNGAIYVSAPPCIYRLIDEDDDGVPEKQEEWYRQKSKMSNCINDIRGPFLGPDGWLYYAKGGAAEVSYGSPDRTKQTKARHFFRRHPDGHLTEPVMTGGMDNPVEMAFLPGGERIYTSTNFQILGQPRRDGIGHALIGALVPKDIADVYGFPWSTPQMYDQPLYQSGAISVSGITYCQHGPWPENVVFAQFSGRCVTRLTMQPKGGSFEATPQDVLTCDDITFHPTDVIEDADGSLLVLDTGGWYLHCCPSSAFFVPNAKGCIYRIRSRETKRIEDPHGLKLEWVEASGDELAARLGDTRPAVRKRSLHQLASFGSGALDSLQRNIGNADARENAIWVASQIQDENARSFVRAGLHDQEDRVRHAALNVISLHRDASSADELIRVLLHDSSGIARRLAAEGLGRCKIQSACAALIEAYETMESDPAMDHALGLALIEVADPRSTRSALLSNNPRVRRAALMALEQMSDGELRADEVMPHLNSSEPIVREAAWWVVARHASDWGHALAITLRHWLSDEDISQEVSREIAANLGRVARASEIQDWMAAELKKESTPEATRIMLLQAMAARTGISGLPDWHEACISIIQDHRASATLLSEAANCLAAMPPLKAGKAIRTQQRIDKINASVRVASGDARLPAEARLKLLRSLRNEIGNLSDDVFDFLVTNTWADQPMVRRGMAADAIAASRLTASQQRTLAKSLVHFSASEISTVLPSLTSTQDDFVEVLLTSLAESSETLAVNPFRITSLLARLSPKQQRRAQPLLDKLAAADADLIKRAERVLSRVPESSLERGHALFQQPKTACINCHVAVLVGGNTGPSLRGLGQRRSERDILESILFPSASFVQSYETWLVATQDGTVLQGVLLRDTPDAIELGNASGKQTIARENIDSMKRSEISIMPKGLEQSLTDQELADLVAYLKSLDH